MRDIIWTLIIVWLIYKVVAVFKNRSVSSDKTNQYNERENTEVNSSSPEKNIKNAVKKHVNNEGEYVDFEEVK